MIGFIGAGIALGGCDSRDSGASKPAANVASQAVSNPAPKEALNPALLSENESREREAAIREKKLQAELNNASKEQLVKADLRLSNGKKIGNPKADTTSRRELQKQRAAARAKSE